MSRAEDHAAVNRALDDQVLRGSIRGWQTEPRPNLPRRRVLTLTNGTELVLETIRDAWVAIRAMNSAAEAATDVPAGLVSVAGARVDVQVLAAERIQPVVPCPAGPRTLAEGNPAVVEAGQSLLAAARCRRSPVLPAASGPPVSC